jgi:hypothetical protein
MSGSNEGGAEGADALNVAVQVLAGGQEPGRVRVRPAPPGVPVKITSPGGSGVTADSFSISSGTEKIVSLIRACCMHSPSR